MTTTPVGTTSARHGQSPATEAHAITLHCGTVGRWELLGRLVPQRRP
ncbi:hypothetical protein ACWDSD_17225 [Streptomyces spiralis]